MDRFGDLVETGNPYGAVGWGFGWVEGECEVVAEFVREGHECCGAAEADDSRRFERPRSPLFGYRNFSSAIAINEVAAGCFGLAGVGRPTSVKRKLWLDYLEIPTHRLNYDPRSVFIDCQTVEPE